MRKPHVLVVAAALAVLASACATASESTTTMPEPTTAATTTPQEPPPTSGGTTGQLVRADLPRADVTGATQQEVAAAANGDTEFAFDFLRATAASDENVILSPSSIATVLTMVYAGARGTTAAEMREALHLTLDDQQIHGARNELDRLVNAPPEHTNEEETSPPFAIRTANSLWGRVGLPFRKGFLETLAVDYGAGVFVADFANAPEEARLAINEWTAEATEDRIRDLLPPEVITQQTVLVLVNAIWFTAGWYFAFDPAATRPGPFTLLDTSKVQAEMMRGQIRGDYLDAQGYKAAVLPYLGDADMVIVVPDHGRFDEVVAGFGANEYHDALDRASTHQLKIVMPKFQIDTNAKLEPALSDLGMVEAFSPAADFSGIADVGGLYLGGVIHKAFIEVDEEGTEAAAATAAYVNLSAPPRAKLTVNRPFLFTITHRTTGEIIFIGQVVDPTM